METKEDLWEQIESFESVEYRIREEGIDYCFNHYSTFKDIQDKTFHKLRKGYLASQKKLEEYIKLHLEELREKLELLEDEEFLK